MATNYLPTREADLLTWSANFNALLKADAAGYGATVEEATAYDAAQTAFAASYQVANDPLTRSPGNIETKNDPRLVAMARELRDRWQEHVTAQPGMLEVRRCGCAGSTT